MPFLKICLPLRLYYQVSQAWLCILTLVMPPVRRSPGGDPDPVVTTGQHDTLAQGVASVLHCDEQWQVFDHEPGRSRDQHRTRLPRAHARAVTRLCIPANLLRLFVTNSYSFSRILYTCVKMYIVYLASFYKYFLIVVLWIYWYCLLSNVIV